MVANQNLSHQELRQSRNWPASKSSCVTTKTVPIAEHSRNSKNFSDSKHFVCSTCQKCVFNANHDSCVTKFLNEVNSRAKVPSYKTTTRYKPVEQTSVAKKPERHIPKRHRSLIKKTSVVHEKIMTPRSCLRWKPTGKSFKTIGLKWIPTGKILTSSTTKVDSEPTNGSNDDITNQYEYKQTLDVSAVTLNIHAGTSLNPTKEGLRVCSELGIHDHSNELSSSKLVPKVVPPADKTTTSRQELELLFHHHITMLRFVLLGEIVSDNGKQFRDNPFKDWCEKLCIRQCFASVKHPQTNGLVERANRSLGEGIKARLDERSKDWIGELSHVLWAHRTMIKSSNGETPFSLTYGTEAVIPAEIGMPTLRTAEVDLIKNDEALEINLDLIEEKREQAAIQEAKSKAKMEKYYNSKVRGTSFKPGDMVYRSNDASHAKDGGKLGPKWEGPYEVTESLGKGAYKLKDRKGNELPRTWNICNLKKCYIHEV
ncbi:reverse transcriptase domain-containing protein [Tanacetum coccineum]